MRKRYPPTQPPVSRRCYKKTFFFTKNCFEIDTFLLSSILTSLGNISCKKVFFVAPTKEAVVGGGFLLRIQSVIVFRPTLYSISTYLIILGLINQLIIEYSFLQVDTVLFFGVYQYPPSPQSYMSIKVCFYYRKKLDIKIFGFLLIQNRIFNGKTKKVKFL